MITMKTILLSLIISPNRVATEQYNPDTPVKYNQNEWSTFVFLSNKNAKTITIKKYIDNAIVCPFVKRNMLSQCILHKKNVPINNGIVEKKFDLIRINTPENTNDKIDIKVNAGFCNSNDAPDENLG